MYESFYKLTGKPFQLSPDASFFFGSRGHKRALSYLRYGLTQGEGFIIITGGVGTGKTTLVRMLFDGLDASSVMAAQLVTTNLEAEDTLRMVAASFGLAHEGASKAAVLKNIETFLMARAREGKRILLVVDEAQNLPAKSLEELRMLSNFQVNGRPLLQSFLLGQEEFKYTLQAVGLEQLRQRVIAAYHLLPLDAEETKAYIEHRLTHVGWQRDPLIEDAAFDVIFENTRGVPRRINTFCDRLMLYAFLEELHEISADHVRTVAEELGNEAPDSRDPLEEEGLVYDVHDHSTPAAPPMDEASSEQVEDIESRLIMVEERLDMLERAFRRKLEPARR